MTREEAINILVRAQRGLIATALSEYEHKMIEALEMALSALRGSTREQVEKVWKGEWEEERFASEHEGWQHRECGRHSTEKTKWCPKCGKAMTDEAVDMVMERLEALGYGKGD